MRLLTEPEQAILVELGSVYVACPGTPLYEAPCMICRAPLRSRPFVLYVIVTLAECPIGDGHIGAGAAAQHTSCAPNDDDAVEQAVRATLTHSYAG